MHATQPPTSYRVIAVLALLWNLFGLASFYLHVTAMPAVVAAWPQTQQSIAAATPSWVVVPFAIATIGGVLGSLGLLLRKRWAELMLLLSLLGILVQFGSIYLLTPALALTGLGGAILPLCIVLVGMFLWYYARKVALRGWIP